MKTTNLKTSEVAKDITRVAAVVVVGAMLYSAVLVLEKTAVWQTMQNVSPAPQTALLTNKKTCILLAWQKQSGIVPNSMEHLRCMEYFPAQGSGSLPAFAGNR